jgi:hypothetical protein
MRSSVVENNPADSSLRALNKNEKGGDAALGSDQTSVHKNTYTFLSLNSEPFI